jgi:hypothetical protein
MEITDSTVPPAAGLGSVAASTTSLTLLLCSAAGLSFTAVQQGSALCETLVLVLCMVSLAMAPQPNRALSECQALTYAGVCAV